MSDVLQAGVRGFRQVDEVVWELPADARPDMRVPARVFADRELIGQIAADRSLEQLQNVATLPGIIDAALAMPDIHQGYGFPVGGVAATELPDGVVSPGGVGYDINCGVRLLALPLTVAELGGRTEALVHQISRRVPVGTGHGGALKLTGRALDRVLVHGPRILLAEHGIGAAEDIEHTESEGCLAGADPAAVSERARVRGSDQLGTLGSGNHFLELQRVARIIDPATAETFGLRPDQVTVLIHSGSRGFGHQVCTDYVRTMDAVLARYRITLPDRQLACAPLSSPEGRRYLAAMARAANFAWGNRAVLAHRVRESVARKSLDRRSPTARARSTMSRTTSPSSSATTAGRCACTARARHVRFHPAPRRSRARTAPSASRCSSQAAWAPAASCSSGSRAR
jgi:tRNA-splicing ligase RtcB